MLGSNYPNWRLGIVGSLSVIILGLILRNRIHPLFWYIGIYPIAFSVGCALFINNSASFERYTAAIPCLAISLLILMNQKDRFTVVLSNSVCIISSLAIIASVYLFIYRDDSIQNLKYMVNDGVYKGLFTTETRAKDLPMMENYLQDIIDDEDYYAFRDNVPAGYLMTHKGKMCEVAAWDCLNYSYGRNNPTILYEYYERRGVIPDKYVYVDFGRDEFLSIENKEYLLNDFINSYYVKTVDTDVNDTFKRVIVYEYQGRFNGDFEYWIND